MKPILLIFLIFAAVIFNCCSKTHDDHPQEECKFVLTPTIATLKGTILFSWHEDGGWKYALSPNLNITRAQINNNNTVGGLECLKQNLARFPENEGIGWETGGKEITGEGATITLSCPPASEMQEISDYCDNLSLDLNIF